MGIRQLGFHYKVKPWSSQVLGWHQANLHGSWALCQAKSDESTQCWCYDHWLLFNVVPERLPTAMMSPSFDGIKPFIESDKHHLGSWAVKRGSSFNRRLSWQGIKTHAAARLAQLARLEEQCQRGPSGKLLRAARAMQNNNGFDTLIIRVNNPWRS